MAKCSVLLCHPERSEGSQRFPGRCAPSGKLLQTQSKMDGCLDLSQLLRAQAS